MRNFLLKFHLFLALFFSISLTVNSQVSWDIYSSVNTGSNPLPTNRVRSIERIGDTLVFLNVGGVTFYHNNVWSGMITGKVNQNEVRDIALNPSGIMYVPTMWSGFYEIWGPNYINNIDDYANYTTYGSGLATNEIICAEWDGNGKVWMGTQGKGVLIKQNTTITYLNTLNSSLLNDTVNDIVFKGNKAYIATNAGLSVYDGSTWQNFAYNGTNGLSNRYCLDLMVAPDGKIWVSTYWGVNVFNDTSFVSFTQTNGIADNHVKKTASDSYGNIWLACNGGISKYNGGSSFTTYNSTGSIATLPFSDVNCLQFDADDNLWVGTENHGVMKYSGNVWTIYDISNSQPHAWFVYSIGEDAQGGIWTSSSQDYFISPEMAYGRLYNGNWTAFTPKTNAGEAIGVKGSDQLLDIYGRHWIATYDKGVAVETNGAWQIYQTTTSSIPTNNINSLAQGKNGDVWVATASGLVKFNQTMAMTLYKTSDGLASNTVNDVSVDSNGVVWAATSNGLSKFNGTNWLTFDTTSFNITNNGSNNVHKVIVDKQQNVWVAISAHGILKFNGSTWTKYSLSNGMVGSDYFNDFFIDKDGFLVAVSSNEGIYKYLNGNWIKYYDAVHVKQPNAVNGYSCGFQASDGNIYCGDWDFGLAKLNACDGFNATLNVLGNHSICLGDSVLLQANNLPGLSYEWFKDSQLIQGQDISFLYAQNAGIYHAIITDTIQGCVSKTDTVDISVNDNDFQVKFKSNDTLKLAPPFNVNFINQTPSISSYTFHWEFGDGEVSSYYHPFHQYQYNGLYDVKLVATHNLTGCKDEFIKNDYINLSGGTACTINAQITPSGAATICGSDSIMLSANSGSGYSYQWVRNGIIIPGADSSIFYAKQTGSYTVIITDAVCNSVANPFMLTHFPAIQPVVQASGIIMPCTNDSTKLSVSGFYNSYSWSNGATTPSIWVNSTGYYYVDVIDQFGCPQTSAQYQLSNSFLSPPEICIIGVDSASGKNRVIWERQNSALIDSIVVLRETNITNVFNKVATIAYSQPGIFIDTAANPAVRPWRYKLAAIDTCGAMSLYSPYHKTIHLTINAGLNGAWNLMWNNYEGFNPPSYYIYRATSTTPMQLLAQVPGTINSFTDINPPAGSVFYEIEIVKANGCFPDSIMAKANTNYNTSRSNKATNGSIQPVFLNADFSANVNSGVWPVQVEFSDNSTGNPDSWRWFFGDGNSSVEANPIHTFNNTGVYTVTLKVCNGTTCDTTVKTNFINVLPNGMVEVYEGALLSVYPNPSNGLFKLDFTSNSSRYLNAEVYSTVGALVFSKQISGSKDFSTTINLEGMAKGIYHLIIRGENGEVITRKLVVE